MHNMSIFGAFTHLEKSIEVKGIQRSVANSVQKMMLNGQKSHFSSENKQHQQQQQVFFRLTSGLGAIPAEADIRESLCHEIRTRHERSRTNAGKDSLFIFTKPEQSSVPEWRIKYFYRNWKALTRDQSVLHVVKGLTLDLFKPLLKPPAFNNLSVRSKQI